jgi:hypothetical protein
MFFCTSSVRVAILLGGEGRGHAGELLQVTGQLRGLEHPGQAGGQAGDEQGADGRQDDGDPPGIGHAAVRRPFGGLRGVALNVPLPALHLAHAVRDVLHHAVELVVGVRVRLLGDAIGHQAGFGTG